MKKLKIVVFDMDGVLVQCPSSWRFVHEYFGVNNDLSLTAFLKQDIDDQEFVRRDTALWLSKRNPLHISVIEDILSKIKPMDGAKEVIETLRNNGIQSAIISGGIDILANRIAKELKIDYTLSNGLRVDENNCLTGGGIIRVSILNKGKVLRNLLEEIGIEPENCIVVGDSFIDISMFEMCKGIAFNTSDERVKENACFVVEGKDLRNILPYLEIQEKVS